MFQYPSSYISPSMTYAFLPSLGYQLCYIPQEPLYLLPQNYLDSPSLSAPHTPQHPEKKALAKAMVSEAPRTEETVILGQICGQGSEGCVELGSKGSQDRVRGQAKQKFGRNISSNIFHLMVKFIKKQKKMRAVVTRIIQSNNMTIKTNEFYQIFKNRSYKLKAYANSAKIGEFWRGPAGEEGTLKGRKEEECSKIFRMLGRQYLHYHHLPYVYNSLKIKSESKRLHMDSIRRILAL